MNFVRLHTLGADCEPGLYLRDAGLPQSKRPYFAWSGCPFEVAFRILSENFALSFRPENMIVDGIMVRDTAYDISSHRPCAATEATLQGADFEARLIEYVAADRRQRAEAFREELRSGIPIAYVFKYAKDEGYREGLAMRALLREMGAPEASTLIVVQEAAHREPHWSEAGIANLYVPRFAEPTAIDGYHRDGWDEAFAKLAVPLRLTA